MLTSDRIQGVTMMGRRASNAWNVETWELKS